MKKLDLYRPISDSTTFLFTVDAAAGCCRLNENTLTTVIVEYIQNWQTGRMMYHNSEHL